MRTSPKLGRNIEMARRYLADDRTSLSKVAAEMGVSRQLVYAALTRMGVKLRTRGEARLKNTAAPPTADAPLIKHLGYAIGAARTAQKLSQYTLGKQTQHSSGTIKRIEHGDPTVPLDVVNEVAGALGFEVALVRRKKAKPVVEIRD